MDKEANVLVIPRHLVFVKFIDVPSLEESEIIKMAEYQAVKEIPHPKEELVISYRNLGSFRSGFSSLMLVIAEKNMIEEKLRKKEAMGINVESIRLHTELIYLYLLKKGVIDEGKTTFVVHIGKEDSEIFIIDKLRPLFSRGFKSSERFLDEIGRSVLVYEREKDNPAIDAVVVSHHSDLDTERVRHHVERHFSVPVNFYGYSDELDKMDLSAKIDLVPRELSAKKSISRKKKESILTYSLAAVFVLLLSLSLLFKMHEKNSFANLLSARMSQVLPEINQLEGLVKKVDIAKKEKEKGMFIIELLEASYSLIPPEISISEVEYNGDKDIFYKGTSKDMASVLDFVKKLEGSKYFKKAEVKYATKKRIKDGEATDFNIACQLNL